MQVEITIHDIMKGDEPPKEGYYLMISHGIDEQISLHNLYWHADKKAWSSAKDSDNLLLPADYWGRYWSENFMNGMVEI